ncbi:MAG: response regulator [Acidobacteria bacterium]|nr:response regulator [Acidobacteriota bacterium]
MANILIVEDNPLVAKFYALALERAGNFRCLRGRTADEVLAHARAGEADLVILDISLANFTHQGRLIDGLEMARLLKNSDPARRIPILLVTAHAMEGDRERFLEASGADGYLEKPIYDPQVLVGKVKELLPEAP